VWNSYDFVFPGVFLQRTVFYPVGTAERSAGGEPADAPLFYRVDEQAVTPMTARSSRYFYAAGARAGDLTDDRVDRLFDVTKAAFHEDKVIIEAQQGLIDLDPERPMLPTSLDAGPTRFRKMVELMVAASS
jgi:vanillate O-demethylase monooxygenase subunit